MKKVLTVLFTLSLCIGTAACVQTKESLTAESYLTPEEIPTVAKFMPLPPKPTDPAFENDQRRYEWGKKMRKTERGKLAVEDADWTFEYLAKIFSEPFGMTISKENTPEIWALLERLDLTSEECSHKAKKRIMRTRPFVQFKERTPVPKDEKVLRKNSSYPSGHTTKGWTFALILAEINPERQDEILTRGFEYGESRVIVGFHYQSDVDAARVIAPTMIARLHADEEFAQQLKKAKKEFQSKK
ncbi:MAG: phosphatase PAP2 family protein [Alphaproteobacteria bacterium]|nr:phosphatase PAP2 family protein [Alphaproteobacteria bacterium]